MKSVEKIIEITQARAASDEEANQFAYVEFARDELAAALAPRKDRSRRAAALLAGVEAAGGIKVCVQREHLLVALGAVEEPGDGDV